MKPPPIDGISPTLAEFKAMLESATGLSDIRKRNGQRLVDLYTKSLVEKRDRVYSDGVAHNEREQEAVERILTKLDDLMDESIEQNGRGDLSDEELLQVTAEVERDRKRLLKMSADAQAVEERAWQEASMSPEAWQASALSRFPALRSRLPRISQAALDGIETPKF